MTKFRFHWIAACAVALTAGFPVHAAEPGDGVPFEPKAPPAQRIAIDPRTGMLAAQPAPAATAVTPGAAVRSAPLAGVRLQNGATRVDLKGRYQMAIVAHRDAAGAITMTCSPAGGLPARKAEDAVAAGQGEASREK